MKDYYQILGVSRDSSDADIKLAYRRLASQHHPDKGGDKSRFQEIQEAYNVLGNSQSRHEYDNPRPFGDRFGPNPGFDFGEIFSMFGVDPRPHQPNNRVVKLNLWITLLDVAQGGPRPISLQVGNKVTTINIDIPPGIDDGDSVRYLKLAPNNGDIIVTFRVRPDPQWQREGKNLITQKEINIWDLILGCEIPIQDIRGRTLMATVPPMTQPGHMLRLRQQGLPANQLPNRNHSPGAGDLLVKIQARLPSNIGVDVLDAIRRETGR